MTKKRPEKEKDKVKKSAEKPKPVKLKPVRQFCQNDPNHSKEPFWQNWRTGLSFTGLGFSALFLTLSFSFSGRFLVIVDGVWLLRKKMRKNDHAHFQNFDRKIVVLPKPTRRTVGRAPHFGVNRFRYEYTGG